MEKGVNLELCKCPPPSRFRKRLTRGFLQLRYLLITCHCGGERRYGLWVTPFFVIKWGSMYEQSEADAIHFVQT